MGRKVLHFFVATVFFSLTFLNPFVTAYAASPGDTCTVAGNRVCGTSGPNQTVLECTDMDLANPGTILQFTLAQLCAAAATCNPTPSAACSTVATPTPTPPPGGPPPSVATGGQWAPQPGLNCGKAVDFAGRPGYPTDPADGVYVCCYPKALALANSSASFASGIPGIGSLLGAVVGVVTGVVDGFPFLGADRASIEGGGFPTVGKLKEALAAIDPCVEGSPSGDPQNAGCSCSLTTPIPDHPLCTMVPAAEQAACKACLGYSGGKFTFEGIYTGIGCVPLQTAELVNAIMSWGIGLAGVSAFACIVYAAFLFQTSQGKPETLQKARELLTSCITGLLLIIFSVFILQVIGVDILKIPGLN